MKINTSRFGEIEVSEGSSFELIGPILGYENETNFAIIEHDEQSKFRWLQSLKSPEIAFVITVADSFGIDYSFELPESVQEALDIESADDLLVLNIVVIPHENPRASTINLLAPLIFNINNKKGAQVILTGTKFQVEHPLFEKEAVC